MNLTEYQLQMLDGLMLGDGTLFLGKGCKKPYLLVGRSNKDFEYIKFQHSVFKEFCSDKGIIVSNKTDKNNGKTYFGSKMRTRAHDCFTEHYNRWYKNKVKIVPQDLRLSPVLVANWFCDDGSISIAKYRNGCESKSLALKFSTHSFSKIEVQFLLSLIDNEICTSGKMYKNSMTWYKNKNPLYTERDAYFLNFNTQDSIKIFNYMKDSFPKGMDRKMNVFKKVIP